MPSLPFELERLIFETSALQDTNHHNRVQLLLVSRRVYEWIRPILYRVAIAERRGLSIRGWRNAPLTEVAPFARHLLICSPLGGSSSTPLFELLSTFHNTENLAIWRNGSIGFQVLGMLEGLPLRMLSVGLEDTGLDEAFKHCSAFMNITHLEITALEGPSWNECKALVKLPKLTHACFGPQVEVQDDVLLGLLVHCPSLLAMIYHEYATESDDPRFLVLQDEMYMEDFIEEWEMSANGGIGLWELADIIIEARKGKLFKDNSSFTFSRRTWMEGLNEDGKQWYKEFERNGQ